MKTTKAERDVYRRQAKDDITDGAEETATIGPDDLLNLLDDADRAEELESRIRGLRGYGYSCCGGSERIKARHVEALLNA